MIDAWRPQLGAVIRDGATAFRVWAPAATFVDLLVAPAGEPEQRRPLTRHDDGTFAAEHDDLPAGTRYGYVLDGDGPFPDPASRSQPDGVHALSETVDASSFPWSDQTWSGMPLSEIVIYELHVGTFTESGTFSGAAERLRDLRALGVTAIELMPVAEFPGRRNWGYDGASLFAPARSYGRPDDLRTLVDRAHQLGLAVILDVVYNHTGPDGSYLSRFSPRYFSTRHRSPWGAGINFDGDDSAMVRGFFIDNALHWVHEYHLDGLRLDATHAMPDDSARHFVAELTARVKASVDARPIHVMAEDHRNLATIVTPPQRGGWGTDAVWADDLHHQVRRRLAGDADGYYRDYTGSAEDLAATIRQGWFYTGQWSTHLEEPRGTDPAGLPPSCFVVCLQNHDQVGNRAFGERLHHQVSHAAYRAASMLLILLPHTPLLFMGQEWGASSPFLYFTDHEPNLGRLVTEGRRREFQSFAAFADEAASATVPDPQAAETFETSRLAWAERESEPHASLLRLYQTLLVFRKVELAPGAATDAVSAAALDPSTVGFRRRSTSGEPIVIVVRLDGAGDVDLRGHPLTRGCDKWVTVLTSEDADFAPDPEPPVIDCDGSAPTMRFAGAAAVVFRGTLPHPGTRATMDEEAAWPIGVEAGGLAP